jgi:hypothetical protein
MALEFENRFEVASVNAAHRVRWVVSPFHKAVFSIKRFEQ